MKYTDAQINEAYRKIFETSYGELVLEDLKKAHHWHSSTVTVGANGQIDPLAMAFAEGERNTILRILTILQTKDEVYNA